MPSYCAETMENNTLFRVPPTACAAQYKIWLSPIGFIGGIFSATDSFLSFCQGNRSNLKPKRNGYICLRLLLC